MGLFSKLVHRALTGIAKRKTKDKLKTEGFLLIGGNNRPYSNKEIEKAFAKMTPEHEKQIQGFVATTVGEVNPPATGRIADWLAALKLWLSDPANREKLMNIIKFIMSIILMLI